MIAQVVLNSTNWTAITTAGQSGSCWLDEDDVSASGSMDVRIIHSASGVPAVLDFVKGKRVYKPIKNTDILVFTADTTGDIYYAKCRNGTATITVDAI